MSLKDEAERLIESCEHTAILKAPKFRSINILDRVTDSDPSVTDYLLKSRSKSPTCKRDILEKTLVEPT